MKIPRKPMKADVPSTAMGDIAFNLLIFFVILARAQDDSHVQWQPAEAANVQGAGTTKVSVAIDTHGDLYLNGQQVGEVQLASRIGSLLGDAGPGNRTVFLKVNKDAPAQKFEPVIEAISEAGGELVHVLEEKR
jgi:biopolymer transport protein ExbD